MSDRQDDLNSPDLCPFADALKQLAPQPAKLSRDALLFAAGKAAGSSHLPAWLWPTATGSFAALSLVLTGFLVSPTTMSVQYVERPQPIYVDRHSEPVVPPNSPSASVDRPEAKKRGDESASDTARMLQVRRDVFRFGIEMLPESKSKGSALPKDVAARDLNRWLNLPPGTFASPGLQPRKSIKREEDE